MDRLRNQIAIEPFGAAFAAKARLLDPAKWHVVSGNGKAVDPYHPAFQRIGHPVDPSAILREGKGRQAIGQAVGLSERLFLGGKSADQRQRAKRFLVHRHGINRYVGQRGRLEEIAKFAAPAAGNHPRSLGDRILDQALQRRRAPGVGQGAHLRLRIKPVANPHPGGAFGKTAYKGIVDPFLDIEAGRRNADLSGVAEFLRYHLVQRRFKITYANSDAVLF